MGRKAGSKEFRMAYTVRHIIETNVDHFWELFFDLALARAMLREFGDVGDFEILEQREDPDGILHRRIECRAKVDLPEWIKKLVGDGTYTEIGRYDRRLKKYNAELVPKHNADKFGTRFEITTEALAGGQRCERVVAVENKVKVFGIGGTITSFLERTQRDGHSKGAAFLNAWIRNAAQPA